MSHRCPYCPSVSFRCYDDLAWHLDAVHREYDASPMPAATAAWAGTAFASRGLRLPWTHDVWPTLRAA